MINDAEIRRVMDDRSCVELTDNLLRTHLPMNAYYPLMGYVALMELRRAVWLNVPPCALYVHGKSSLRMLPAARGLYTDEVDMPMPLCAIPITRLQDELMRGETLLTYESWSLSENPAMRPHIDAKLVAISCHMDCMTRAGVIVAGRSPLQISTRSAAGYYAIDVGNHVTYDGTMFRALSEGVIKRTRAAFARHLRTYPDMMPDVNLLYRATRDTLRKAAPGVTARSIRQAAGLLTGWEVMESWRCKTLGIPRDAQRLREAAHAIGHNLDISNTDMEVLTHD